MFQKAIFMNKNFSILFGILALLTLAGCSTVSHQTLQEQRVAHAEQLQQLRNEAKAREESGRLAAQVVEQQRELLREQDVRYQQRENELAAMHETARLQGERQRALDRQATKSRPAETPANRASDIQDWAAWATILTFAGHAALLFFGVPL